MENSETQKIPEREKPPILYHGSIASDIKEFEPRKRYTPDGKNMPELVYAGDDPAFAAAHSFPWGSNEGFDLSIRKDGKVLFRVPEKFKERLMRRVYVYKLPSDKFNWTTEEKTGHTLHASEKVAPTEVQEFNSVEEAIKNFGGEVIYTKD